MILFFINFIVCSAVAYTVALGLFLAVGRETTGKIPPGKVKYHVEEGTVSQCALGVAVG